MTAYIHICMYRCTDIGTDMHTTAERRAKSRHGAKSDLPGPQTCEVLPRATLGLEDAQCVPSTPAYTN
jgi:hypothetical protein